MLNDWMITYPGTLFRFGTLQSGYAFDVAPALGGQSVVADDYPIANDDGRGFGSDFLDGDSVTFAIDIMAGSSAEARDLLEQARQAWRADTIRREPGAMAALTSENGRVTFGRPRRFVPDSDGVQHGNVRISADFASATDLWFGPEKSVTVPLVPPPGGGLIAPLASPLATTASSDRSQAVSVDGELSTWPVVTVRGPITNPVVEVLGCFRWELRLTLEYDQRLVIDTRPWARTILRGRASMAGALTPASTRLSKSQIPPGLHEFVLRGTSAGTPSATLTHRPAFHTP